MVKNRIEPHTIEFQNKINALKEKSKKLKDDAQLPKNKEKKAILNSQSNIAWAKAEKMEAERQIYAESEFIKREKTFLKKGRK